MAKARLNANDMPSPPKLVGNRLPAVVTSCIGSSTVSNEKLRYYSYWRLVRGTVAATQHLSFVALFCLVWRLISDNAQPRLTGGFVMTTEQLLILDASLLIGGLCIGAVQARFAVVSLGFLWMLTPVLQTLTKAFSDDTVFALTTIFLLFHVLFYDYTYTQRSSSQGGDRLQSIMAVNAGMLAAVVLASRLVGTVEVFAFLLFATEIFSLSPSLGTILWQWDQSAYTAATLLLFVLTAISLGNTIGGVGWVYILG
eukprot:Selendium_serpulae@DN6395_c1_g2_i6.p1